MKMFWIVLLAALALLVAGGETEPAACTGGTCPCETTPFRAPAAPVVDLPQALRVSNWGGGSCVHASTVHLLHWQGQHPLADWWRHHYQGGEYATRLHQRLDAARLRYAFTVNGDVAFLEWALRTRRGAGITYFPGHAVNLVHLDETHAGLLDNNRIHEIIWIPRDEFVRRWQGYGGWAWTLVYDPPPPLPYLSENSL